LHLHELGWNSHFEHHFAQYAEEGLVAGRVGAEHRGALVVFTENGDMIAKPSGALRHNAAGRGDLPAVGDWVALRPRPGDETATIVAVLPRRTKFSRKGAGAQTEEQVLAANIDVLFLVSALTQELSLRRIERYLALAWESGAEPVVVLNKLDLCDDLPDALAEVGSVAVGAPVHAVSSVTGEGFGELERYLAGHRTVALLGSSGVGKSTILNRLLGTEQQRTQDVRADDRGRHTTTHRELVPLPGGGLVIDTPGIRELQLWDADEGLGSTFADIEALAEACRFTDCRHETEPGCEILRALGDGSLTEERLESYRKLQKELAYLDVRQDARARSERRKEYRRFAKEMRARMKGGGR